MESSFWHKRWEANEIGFHENKPNPLLVKHFNQLSLKQGNRLFLPLCGKSQDIIWLIKNGFKVVGVELSTIAVEQFFKENQIQPHISKQDKFILFSGNNIDIFVGDFFDLTAIDLGAVDAIYDRAALVALPETMRKDYTEHLIVITDKKPQLLICFDYDQSLLPGPPFSIPNTELSNLYGSNYNLKLLESTKIEGGLKGKCEAKENIWHLINSASA